MNTFRNWSAVWRVKCPRDKWLQKEGCRRLALPAKTIHQIQGRFSFLNIQVSRAVADVMGGGVRGVRCPSTSWSFAGSSSSGAVLRVSGIPTAGGIFAVCGSTGSARVRTSLCLLGTFRTDHSTGHKHNSSTLQHEISRCQYHHMNNHYILQKKKGQGQHVHHGHS